MGINTLHIVANEEGAVRVPGGQNAIACRVRFLMKTDMTAVTGILSRNATEVLERNVVIFWARAGYQH